MFKEKVHKLQGRWEKIIPNATQLYKAEHAKGEESKRHDE